MDGSNFTFVSLRGLCDACITPDVYEPTKSINTELLNLNWNSIKTAKTVDDALDAFYNV